MPRAILEFNLPEDRCDFEVAVAAMNFALAWDELEEYLRQRLKYERRLPKKAREALEAARSKMVEISEDRNLPELT